MTRKLTLALTMLLLLPATHVFAQTNTGIIVKANEVKATVQPTMYGIFFEDINFGPEGGIYV